MRPRKKREDSTGLAIGLVLIALSLNLFSCSWSGAFQKSSPTAIYGIQSFIGVYAKNDVQQDTMLGVLVPAALICVGAFMSRQEF